jgi:glycosyltransferase involved in cell wall biosynthesis
MAAHAPRADWLRDAVASALDQRGCALELLVIDDGSPTPISEMLPDYGDHRLRVIRTEHRGESSARNAGIAASDGDYLRFLDSDDVFPSGSTALLLDLVRGSDKTVGVGATRWCSEDLIPIYDRPAGFGRDPLRDNLLLRCTPMHFSMLFPREVVAAAGPWDPDFPLCQDWDFISRVLEHGDFAETRRPVTWYRQHEHSLGSNPTASWQGTLLGVERYFERHPEQRRTHLERQVNSMLDLLTAELEQSGPVWRNRHFWRALVRDPTALRTVYVRQILPRLSRVRLLLSERSGVASESDGSVGGFESSV